MSAPLITLRAAAVTFGGRPLFTGVDLAIGRRERLVLVGRNGSGKSTLLRVLAGEVELDQGERMVAPGARSALLAQDPAPALDATAAAYVAEGLGAGVDDYRVRAVLAEAGLEGGALVGTLSGGERRRAALARALVAASDVLLLDEPTNHLDLAAIEWLEARLADFAGALVLISHDRALLSRVGTRTAWLDRGCLRVLEAGFAGFEPWAEGILAEEDAARARLAKRIDQEEDWVRHGVTARRRRNQGRLRALQVLRRERAAWLGPTGGARLEAAAAAASGGLVIEAEGAGKRFPAADGERTVVAGLTLRIRRGDRFGIIGANGSGKTTLVRLLIGALAPDVGTVRHGTRIEVAYMDQMRAVLDPDATLWATLAEGGGDTILVGGLVGGRQRHVVSYLRDFLFAERQALSPVRSLSGGERNRLVLAKLFARPSNLLVLDEPTNDLDMETLDLLQEQLADYPGTVLLVSHDRDFLDRVVAGVIAAEGEGRWREYPGGYSDYLRQRPAPAPVAKPVMRAPATPRPRVPRARLGYQEGRELERLPAEIERLTAERRAIETGLADPTLFQRDSAGFAATTQRLAELDHAIREAEERWLALAAKAESLVAGGPD